jgi:hypothetical protein
LKAAGGASSKGSPQAGEQLDPGLRQDRQRCRHLEGESAACLLVNLGDGSTLDPQPLLVLVVGSRMKASSRVPRRHHCRHGVHMRLGGVHPHLD